MIFNPAKQEIEHYPEFCRIFIWIKFNQTVKQMILSVWLTKKENRLFIVIK